MPSVTFSQMTVTAVATTPTPSFSLPTGNTGAGTSFGAATATSKPTGLGGVLGGGGTALSPKLAAIYSLHVSVILVTALITMTL